MASADNQEKTPPQAPAAAGRAPALTMPSLSTLALVAANCVPLVGVIFLRWDLLLVMAAYWLENVVVGFYNVLRMLIAAQPRRRPEKIFGVVFFALHYGGFTVGHGVFIFALFGPETPPGAGLGIGELLAARQAALLVVLGGLFASHGVSFVANYLLKKEYLRAGVGRLLFGPYARIVVLHVTVVLGGGLITLTRLPQAALCLLVALKTALDLFAHRREHRKLAEPPKNPRPRLP